MIFYIAIVMVGLVLIMNRNAADFVLWIQEGKVVRVKGLIQNSLQEDLESILDSGQSGKVLGFRHKQFVRLSFKGQFDESSRQRLRNIANFH